MYKLKFGKSIRFGGDDYYEEIRTARERGLESVDFDLCTFWTQREREIEEYKELEPKLEALKASGLYFNGVHISFGRHWDFSETDEEKRTEAVTNFCEIAPLIDRYRPGCYIIHGSYEPIAPENRAAKIEALKRSLCEMMAVTDTVIAVEILPRSCLLSTAAEACELVDSMDSEQIKVCVDVNHFLQEKAEDGVLALGSRIVTTHISDHDYENERHWMPGEGKIDWMALIGALEKIGYDGAFNYEVAESIEAARANFDGLFGEYNSR